MEPKTVVDWENVGKSFEDWFVLTRWYLRTHPTSYLRCDGYDE